MKTSDFYFELPEELIAQTPLEKRDESRLMTVSRQTGDIEHRKFRDIKEYLRKGDVLVLNDTRVLPARLIGEKVPTGAKMEFLLLKRIDMDTWQVMVKPGKRAKPGSEFSFGDGSLRATVEDIADEGTRIVRFEYEGVFESVLDELGSMPLPPYIKETLQDKERYQTVYSKHSGSAAAPTAGLHFTPELLEDIRAMGVEIAYITLHVGLGTFRPVKMESIEEHQMHSEFYTIDQSEADKINLAKSQGNRVIAVGTTSCRTLETAADTTGRLHASSGWTDIFIYPGYKFKLVDAIITNFHLPESTLIMLVSAFSTREQVLRAYNEAVSEGYRFFSFGDSMFIY